MARSEVRIVAPFDLVVKPAIERLRLRQLILDRLAGQFWRALKSLFVGWPLTLGTCYNSAFTRGRTMNRSTAWQWIPALCAWRCTAFTGAVLLLGIVCPADAGINVWTGGGFPAFTNLAIVPGRPSTLYASTFNLEDGWVYKSTDGGSTWDQTLHVSNPTLCLL